MTVLITSLIVGGDTFLFEFYSDVDNYTIPFERNISKAQLLSGYLSSLVPDGTTTIRVQSTLYCFDFTDLEITPFIPTTTTTTISTSTSTTSTSTSTSVAPLDCEINGTAVLIESTTSTTTTNTSTTTSTSTSTTTNASTTTCIPSGTSLGFYCSGYDRRQLFADGNCGTYSILIEANSILCGYVPPTTTTSTSTTTLAPNCTLEGTVSIVEAGVK